MNDQTFINLTRSVIETQKIETFSPNTIVAGDSETISAYARLCELTNGGEDLPKTNIPIAGAFAGVYSGVSSTDANKEADDILRDCLTRSQLTSLSTLPLDENTYYVLSSINYFVERANKYAEFLTDYRDAANEASALNEQRRNLLRALQ